MRPVEKLYDYMLLLLLKLYSSLYGNEGFRDNSLGYKRCFQ